MNQFRQLSETEMQSIEGGVDLGASFGAFLVAFFTALGDLILGLFQVPQ